MAFTRITMQVVIEIKNEMYKAPLIPPISNQIYSLRKIEEIKQYL